MNRPSWMPHPGAALVLTLLAALAGGLASLVVTAFNRTPSSRTPSSHSLRVRELVVEDSKGVARAVLGSTPEGVFGLRLRDGKGRDRMQFVVAPDGLFGGAPAISLLSKKGDPHVVLLLGADDDPSLGLRIGGAVGKTLGPGANLYVSNTGAISMSLMGYGKGRARLNVGSIEGGSASFKVGSASLNAVPGKTAYLTLTNPDGEMLLVDPGKGVSRPR